MAEKKELAVGLLGLGAGIGASAFIHGEMKTELRKMNEKLSESVSIQNDIKTELKGVKDKLDVALTVMAKLQRWGRDVDPIWIHAAEVTAPAAGTALVSKTVTSGKIGYIYGFFISTGEANDFMINWTSGETAHSIRVVFPGAGSLMYVDIVPINEGSPADGGTTVSITNIKAGSAGVAYQARILYAEV